ncbi:MAG: hypothetical protein WCR04_11150 [Fibrobacteraceae bacterium]
MDFGYVVFGDDAVCMSASREKDKNDADAVQRLAVFDFRNYYCAR